MKHMISTEPKKKCYFYLKIKQFYVSRANITHYLQKIALYNQSMMQMLLEPKNNSGNITTKKGLLRCPNQNLDISQVSSVQNLFPISMKAIFYILSLCITQYWSKCALCKINWWCRCLLIPRPIGDILPQRKVLIWTFLRSLLFKTYFPSPWKHIFTYFHFL